MTSIAKLSPIVLLLGLAGCATAGSNYIPPSIEAPRAYAAQPVGVDDAAVEIAWWKLLGDPALRDQIVSCIGCGCLSLDECPLRNPMDELGRSGPGPRRLIGG